MLILLLLPRSLVKAKGRPVHAEVFDVLLKYRVRPSCSQHSVQMCVLLSLFTLSGDKMIPVRCQLFYLFRLSLNIFP